MLRTSLATLGLVAVSLAQPGHAQTADGPSDEPVEEIIVTGSRLPRRDFSAPSPIASIDQEALAASGQATLEEALNRMPQVAPDFGRTSNNPGDGTSRVNLRGLGANRTLVLLNGRRIAPSGIGTAVDVNNLPQALIDRVEVITGGATTVYGSDAVAGVVNFITRKDFEGFGIDTSAYVTEQGDANVYDINVTWGHDFGDGNIALYGGYYDREAMFASEREFAAVTWRDDWQGGIELAGSSTVPQGVIFSPRVDWGNGAARTTFDPNGDPREYDGATDYYNYAPVNYLQVPLRRVTGGLFLDYELANGLEFYAELSLANNEAAQTLAPVPAGGPFLVNTDNPELSPANQQFLAANMWPAGPNLVEMVFGRRMVEVGPRIFVSDRDYARVAAGIRGDIGENWDFDAWATFTTADESVEIQNGVSASRMQQGLLVDPVTGQCTDPSGGCVPTNFFGLGNLTQEAADFIRFEPITNVSSRDQKLVSAYIRGAPFESWAGPVNVAFGAEWRSDKGGYAADPILATGDGIGLLGDASVNGKESVFEVYSEATLPLAEGAAWAEYLGLEVGARYSDYKHAGGVTTWKAGAEWQFPAPVRFRTMYQRSVRAPNLLEAFQETFVQPGSFAGSNGVNDPCTAQNDPVAQGLFDACVASGLPPSEVGTWTATAGLPTDFFFGGNPLLEPEVAKTFTAGFVFDVDWLQGLQVSIDYFDLEVEDTIGMLDVTLACFDVANSGQAFCDNIVRDPVTYDVVEAYQPYENRGTLAVRGIDTLVNLEADLPTGDASVGVDLAWTHALENSYQETAYGSVFECSGSFGWPCIFTRDTSTYPENKLTMGIDYYSGDFSGRLTWRWIEGTTNGLVRYKDLVGLGFADLGLTDVPSKSYFDLGFGYRFSDNIFARLMIANLADEKPAFMADYPLGGGAGNTDGTVYDVFGRAYTLSLSLTF